MSFRASNIGNISRFNSAVSCNLLDMYENHVNKKISEKNNEPASRTFAPSGFRCKRKMWFRLRGTQPDKISKPDSILQFTADVGTACHRIIQKNLENLLQENWINVEQYLNQNCKFNFSVRKDPESDETQVEIFDLPVRFACDGIIRLDNKYYLLEIKSSDRNSFQDMTDAKSEHIDQVKCYSALINIEDVIFLYIDRAYGEMKCYQYKISEFDREKVISDMKYVMQCVETNIPPDPLPSGDKWCSSNYCPYYAKCKEWGR